jgi:hypothetical protein
MLTAGIAWLQRTRLPKPFNEIRESVLHLREVLGVVIASFINSIRFVRLSEQFANTYSYTRVRMPQLFLLASGRQRS